MRKYIVRFLAVNCALLSIHNSSSAGVEDLIKGLKRLVGAYEANHMDHLISNSPGRFLDLHEVKALIKCDEAILEIGPINRASFSAKQASQARIIDRLIYEVEAVLKVPKPNLSRFTHGVSKLPTANLTKRGVTTTKLANIWFDFQITHRELQGLLDQFEILKGRFRDIDPRLEEYLDGLGKSYSSQRALAETLGDIITISDRAMVHSVIGESEMFAQFSRLFNRLSLIFEEVQSAKILMETHVNRLATWLKSSEGELPIGFNDFLERHASGTLAQRFARTYRISADPTGSLQEEYATLFRPLISTRSIGEAEEMLTLLWTRESFKSLKATISEFKAWLSKYPRLVDVASEMESIIKARSGVIDGRLAQARFKILFPNWEDNALELQVQLTKVQKRLTSPIPDVFDPTVLPDQIKTHLISELNTIIGNSNNSASAISEFIGDIDEYITVAISTSKQGSLDISNTFSTLRTALTTLKAEVGHVSNSLDDLEKLQYVINRPDLRRILREFIDLRLDIVDDLELQISRGSVTY